MSITTAFSGSSLLRNLDRMAERVRETALTQAMESQDFIAALRELAKELKQQIADRNA